MLLLSSEIFQWHDYSCEINEIVLSCTDDGHVLKALNTRAPETRDQVGQVIVSDVQVLKSGKSIRDNETQTID